MATPRVPQKWRPTLTMIVLAVLLIVLALPAAIIFGLRILDRSSQPVGVLELGALSVALVITVVIAVVFARTINGPIKALIRRTEEIGRGGRAAIVATEQQGTREIATLSQSFLDLAEQLVDRTEYVSSFAAHVSHELKSPVTAIRGSAELLRDVEMTSTERRRFLDNIIADSDRLAALLERLRELARADLDVASGRTTLREALADEPMVRLSGAVEVPVELGLEAMRTVFAQLIGNAAEHGSTELRVAARREGQWLAVQVEDNGAGISEGNRDRIFEPFFTTRRESGGTGMGLQIVRSMLAAHGGRIELAPSTSGAAFDIRLPMAEV